MTVSPLGEVLFLGKKGDAYSESAARIVSRLSARCEMCLADRGEPCPPAFENWQGDLIISYLSRWVVPADTLARATQAAINFHPAPPEYPEFFGCHNFALYEESTAYGVTCHHMLPEVNRGAIIAAKRFPIRPQDNVDSLLKRTHAEQFDLFENVMDSLANNRPLPESDETWGEKRHDLMMLEELSVITRDMPDDEIQRRVRAVSYGDRQPEITLAGHRFRLMAD